VKVLVLFCEQGVHIATGTIRVNMVELVSARVQTTMSACVRSVDVPVSQRYPTVV